MPLVTFDFMDVGQGDCTFIQVCNGNSIGDRDITPDHAILVDFGSSKNGFVAGPDAAAYIGAQLGKMMVPTIELIVLTHSDEDHHNLIIPQLLEIDDLEIGEVLYSGRRGDYSYTPFMSGRERNTIDSINTYAKKEICFGLSSDCSSLLAPGAAPYAVFDGLRMWIVIANYPSDSARDPNTKSIVTLWEYAGYKVILPGDATAATLEEINRWTNWSGTEDMVRNASVLRLPHHGSERTTLKGNGADKWQVTDHFASLVRPRAITIGADTRGDYRHPRQTVIDRYDGLYMERGLYGMHRYISWGPSAKGIDEWVYEDTDKNIFTSLIDMYQGAQYQLRLDSAGPRKQMWRTP